MPLPPFQEFFDTHSADVFNFLVTRVGPTSADDCFQETFLAALRAYPGLRPGSNLRAWVFTIARGKAVDAHRKAARTRAVPLDGIEVAEAARPEPVEVWEPVAALPPKQRQAVAYRYLVDLDYAEVARRMGTTEPAARRNVHEGLKKLREVHLR